ncbi:hypothetical protein ACVIIV_003304 [Bradyrhizobium sp. USDA 4354]
MEPVTTSKVPAIIRKCGNFKVAKRASHAVSANFSTPLAHRLMAPRLPQALQTGSVQKWT